MPGSSGRRQPGDGQRGYDQWVFLHTRRDFADFAGPAKREFQRMRGTRPLAATADRLDLTSWMFLKNTLRVNANTIPPANYSRFHLRQLRPLLMRWISSRLPEAAESASTRGNPDGIPVASKKMNFPDFALTLAARGLYTSPQASAWRSTNPLFAIRSRAMLLAAACLIAPAGDSRVRPGRRRRGNRSFPAAARTFRKRRNCSARVTRPISPGATTRRSRLSPVPAS